LTDAIQRLLPGPRAASPVHRPELPAGEPGLPAIFVVDDDIHVRTNLRTVLEEGGKNVEDFA
jgi:hypothetical protein